MDSREVKPELQISSASDFKKKADERNKVEVLTLPSGLIVKLKRPAISKLLKEKLIPAELLNSVYSSASVGGETKPDIAKSIEFMDKMITLSLLEPLVKEAPDYDAGEISIEDIAEDDKGAIFTFINEGGKGQNDLKSFPKQ